MPVSQYRLLRGWSTLKWARGTGMGKRFHVLTQKRKDQCLVRGTWLGLLQDSLDS